MIPDDVEKIIMTKEDYDRNVEQLLLEKINAEQEIEKLNQYVDFYKDLGEKQNKEIERLNNIIKEQGIEDKPNYYVKGLEGSLKEYQEEVKSLNNIINELEKWLVEWREMLDCPDFYEEGIIDCINDTLTKLQQLKGVDKE